MALGYTLLQAVALAAGSAEPESSRGFSLCFVWDKSRMNASPRGRPQLGTSAANVTTGRLRKHKGGLSLPNTGRAGAAAWAPGGKKLHPIRFGFQNGWVPRLSSMKEDA